MNKYFKTLLVNFLIIKINEVKIKQKNLIKYISDTKKNINKKLDKKEKIKEIKWGRWSRE